MNKKHRVLLERYLDGSLTPTELETFKALRSHDPTFDASVVDAEALGRVVEGSGPLGFQPGFEARVMAQINARAAFVSDDAMMLLWRMFPRVAVPASALTVLIMLNNYLGAPAGASILEALFGLPARNIVAVLGALT